MKKLLIASAIAASFAGVAMANPVSGLGFSKPFVAVTAGTNTNDEYATKNIAAHYNNDTDASATHQKYALIGGIQLGADLFTANNVAFGAELDGSHDLISPNLKVTSTDNTVSKVTVSRYSLNPMAFVAVTPVSKLTLKAKAGYGYQHAETQDNNTAINEGPIHAWKPVVAGEAQYNLTKNVGIFAGDRYTFGKKDANTNGLLEANKNMPRENVVYAGLKYTF